MTVQIPVSADLGPLEKKLDALGRKIDAINKKKWSPVDPAAVERDANKVEKTLTATQRRVAKQRKAAKGGAESEEDARRAHYGIRKRYTYAPEFGDVPRAAMGGFGGGFSQIAGAGSRGAIAGAQGGGGVGGGVMGLLRGTAIGALAFGAFKAASAVSEGVDMARERAGTLDTLKRQMGDVGISFERLKVASESAAYGLGINSKDFAVLEQQMNVASRGADHDPLALQNATSVAAGFGRSYGMDPGASASIFGGARNIDQRQNYRQFALILAETIEKSGMSSRAEEVMQAVLSFATLSSRLSLSTPNTAAFGGAYAGLVNSGVTGMTPELAAQILGQANNATANMGAAGEAGQAFTLAAFQHGGHSLNPLEASAEASGGLFGSRASVFGHGSEMERLLGSDASGKLAGGPGADTTNFKMLLDQSRRLVGNGTQGKELQAEMLQRYFGLSSIQQAASLMNLQDSGQMGGLNKQIQAAGIDPSKINFTNVQTLAKIGNASGMGGLDSIYDDLKKREGTSALGKDDTSNIDRARGQGEDAYRNALFVAANGKDYAQDTATIARDSKAVLDNIQINTGDKLFGAITGFKDDMISLFGGRKALDKGRLDDAEYMYQQGTNATEADRHSQLNDMNKRLAAHGQLPQEADMDAIAKINAQADEALQLLDHQHDYDTKPTNAGAAQLMADSLKAGEITLHNHVKVYMDKDGNVHPIAPQKVGVPNGSGSASAASH